MRPLSEGAWAVVLFNRSERQVEMEATWEEIGLIPNQPVEAVNVWTDEIRCNLTSPLVDSVSPHAVSFWILTPASFDDKRQSMSGETIKESR